MTAMEIMQIQQIVGDSTRYETFFLFNDELAQQSTLTFLRRLKLSETDYNFIYFEFSQFSQFTQR